MSERSILLNGMAVRAVLANCKTQTRWPKDMPRRCPLPGDRLWVRETWSPLQNPEACWAASEPCDVVYRADDGWADNEPDSKQLLYDGKWRPSVHMPRWASRIMLEVTDTRRERVQDISNEDAIAEGVEFMEVGPGAMPVMCPKCQGSGRVTIHDGHSLTEIECEYCNSPVKRFRILWDSIYGGRGYGWEENPWVWVIEFRGLA